ncbi:MAG: type II secretion system protein [Candidatus Contendobacter sp.]
MNRRSAGFSLLEAIVALALVASVGTTLLSWLNGSLIGLNRARAVSELQVARRNALAYLELINPMTTPEGEAKLGDWTLRWRVSEIEPARDGLDYPGLSLYQVGLYDIEVRLERGADEAEIFVLRQVGYRQVREPDLDF